MAILTYDGTSYSVDHAVKGGDFIHGYDAEGTLIVAFEGVSNFSSFVYDGTYMVPEKCLEEGCNVVKHVDGALMRSDGTSAGHEHSADDITAGTLSIDRGGTGAATSTEAHYHILKDMLSADTAITDENLFVFKRTQPDKTKGVLLYKKATLIWNYIKGKIKSTYGFTASNVLPIENGGTGSTTDKGAEYAINGSITEYDSDIANTTQVIIKYATPNSSKGVFIYKKASAFWTYFADKVRNTFGFSGSDVLSVEHGGTGASTVAGALFNLGMVETPEMLLDTEYAVNEKFNGKQVYTYIWHVGIVPYANENTEKSYTVPVDIPRLVRFNAWAETNISSVAGNDFAYSIPYVRGNASGFTGYVFATLYRSSKWYLYVTHKNTPDMGEELFCQVWYTKD